MAARGGQPVEGGVDTARVVHQPEDEFGLGRHAEIRQRRKIGIVVAVARHGHVHPLDAARYAGRQRVGETDADRQVPRFDHMLVAGVAVTEMNTQLGGFGQQVGQLADPPDRPIEGIVVEQPGPAFNGDHFGGDVPLDRKIIIWNCRDDIRQFGAHRLVVGRFDSGLDFRIDEAQDNGDRRRQTDLKPRSGGNHPFGAELLEYGVGFFRFRRITECAEIEPGDVFALDRAVVRAIEHFAAGLHRHPLHQFDPGMRLEHIDLVANPDRTGARLAIGVALGEIADLFGDRPERSFGIRHAETADKMNGVRHLDLPARRL